MQQQITRDAEEFGVHVRAGGWRLGLLVARNVEKGQRGGDTTISHTRNGKVPAYVFAKQAGTSADRVLRYLSAWEHAAADGLVKPAHELSPGEEVELDADKLGDWSDYYPPVHSLDGRSKAHRKAIEAAAHEEGTTPEQVQRASASRPALAAAIKADPKIAETAMRALDQRYERERETLKSNESKRSKEGAPLALIVEFRALHRTVERLLTLVAEGHAVVSDDERDALLEEVAWLRNALDYVESGLNAGSLDKALAELLEGGL